MLIDMVQMCDGNYERSWDNFAQQWDSKRVKE